MFTPPVKGQVQPLQKKPQVLEMNKTAMKNGETTTIEEVPLKVSSGEFQFHVVLRKVLGCFALHIRNCLSFYLYFA